MTMYRLFDIRTGRPISVARYFTIWGALADLENLRKRIAHGERQDIADLAEYAYVGWESIKNA